MASCSYCGTTILFGGIRQDEYLFCGAKCARQGAALVHAKDISLNLAEKTAREIFFGDCPRCHGKGPVDLHTSYEVLSFLFMTRYSSHPSICCRSCGNKQRLKGFLYTFFLGWWGFPWGLVMTPWYLAKNLFGIMHPTETNLPSEALVRIVRVNIAAQALAQKKMQA